MLVACAAYSAGWGEGAPATQGLYGMHAYICLPGRSRIAHLIAAEVDRANSTGADLFDDLEGFIRRLRGLQCTRQMRITSQR